MSGRLYLSVNDNWFADNTGAWAVQVMADKGTTRQAVARGPAPVSNNGESWGPIVLLEITFWDVWVLCLAILAVVWIPITLVLKLWPILAVALPITGVILLFKK